MSGLKYMVAFMIAWAIMLYIVIQFTIDVLGYN